MQRLVLDVEACHSKRAVSKAEGAFVRPLQRGEARLLEARGTLSMTPLKRARAFSDALPLSAPFTPPWLLQQKKDMISGPKRQNQSWRSTC